MLKDKGDISKNIGVNIKKKSDGAFKLLQSNLVEKIINYVGLLVSESFETIETPAVNHYCINMNLV